MNDTLLPAIEYQSLLAEYAESFTVFEQLLVDENQKYNLTRITEPKQIRLRHFIDSMAGLGMLDELSTSLKKSLRILDIGSGAGFPGLVLAISRPEWQIVSLEATGKKVQFQKMVCDALKLSNVSIIHGRAEDIARQALYREQFDAVTARALAAMPVLAELSLGFVKLGGLALYWKGPSANEELKAALTAINEMGAEIQNTLSYTLPSMENEPANLSLIVCKKIKPTPKHYPRVFGMIKKRPL
jgi:16S rRNA (guanine527-N7)-methyltransferase